MRNTLTLALGLAALPSIALAHISFVEASATAETSFKAVLAVPHGCDGKTTEAITVSVPEGFIAAKPMPKPGWTLTVRQGAYAKSYKLHGEAVTSGVTEIVWSKGHLEDAWYDEFTLRGTFSGIEAGTDVAFPVLQTCEGGASIDWNETAAPGVDPHSLEHPAPVVAVTTGGMPDEHAGHRATAGEAAQSGSASIGEIAITSGFVRAMLPGQKVGGGYLTIVNKGGADRLVSATTPGATSGEVHQMAMEGDVMRMRPLPDGLDIPAGGTVELKPGGLHVMFTGVATPFAEGAIVPVTLTFQKAGTVNLQLPVLGAAAKEGIAGHDHQAMQSGAQ